MDLRQLRNEYEHGEIDEAALPNLPLAVFERWMGEAIKQGIPEPTAMTVATVSPEGRPSTRVVLLKKVDANGLVFYTNYSSHKAREIEANPHAAAQFYWVEAERVVRIEGQVEKVSPEESDEYFSQRPLDSRIGAWASPQSEVIASRASLLAAAAKVAATMGLNPPRPPFWGGYRIVPETWEFWQGRTSRLHDRIRYRKEEGQWIKERLAP